MNFERGTRRLLLVISALILVAGGYVVYHDLMEARQHQHRSTSTGCNDPDSELEIWCSPKMRATEAQIASAYHDSAYQTALWTIAIVAALSFSFYARVLDHPGLPAINMRAPPKTGW